MRRLYVSLLLGIAAIAVLAPLAGAARSGATLTAAEQKWVTPLIKVWNVQNQSIQVVVSQATAKSALIAGEKPQNLALTNTLAAIVNCKEPADLIKRAGKSPTPRLVAFRNALNSACIHDLNGANDFAKAIGAVGTANYHKAQILLKSGYSEFKRGSTQLTKAYASLVALGGKKAFKA
jgi:hypothetical protein